MQKLHQHDIITGVRDPITGEQHRIEVPILKEENLCEDMAMDEKYIGGEYYTILSSRHNGKIALMAATQKSEHLCALLAFFGPKNFTVKYVTRDLNGSYDWVCRQMFMNASQVADKFHILANMFDSLQSIRIYHRQKLLSKRKDAYETFKTREHLRKKTCAEQGLRYQPARFQIKEHRFENGDSLRELLARSQYLLYKKPDQWTHTQQQRAGILFTQYPDLERAYELCLEFRRWYDPVNLNLSLDVVKDTLGQWYINVGKAAIEEISSFKSMVERHEGIILNYFVTGKTNALAESMNAKIQRFIHTNNGARDKDFTFFRIANFFS